MHAYLAEHLLVHIPTLSFPHIHYNRVHIYIYGKWRANAEALRFTVFSLPLYFLWFAFFCFCLVSLESVLEYYGAHVCVGAHTPIHAIGTVSGSRLHDAAGVGSLSLLLISWRWQWRPHVQECSGAEGSFRFVERASQTRLGVSRIFIVITTWVSRNDAGGGAVLLCEIFLQEVPPTLLQLLLIAFYYLSIVIAVVFFGGFCFWFASSASPWCSLCVLPAT
ncbi:hypothetical protein DQ04_06741030 [Trypanosoma grayi]|uniref:hypothetical protein n=1 Tax=Trypanosoma grayi TaxID=71804 RepID=UPI0004F4A0A7|nr:hypothetical protein DQ04_06741030 [Trypanosoma grayi]KEG08642.1 hypothetical protein DQ04_06741030 [Trypanosoma grayi]